MSNSGSSQEDDTKFASDGNKLFIDFDSLGIDKSFDGTKKESFMTNEAKVELVLREFCDATRWRTDIMSVISVIIAIMLALITGSFKSTLGIEASIWSAVFIT